MCQQFAPASPLLQSTAQHHAHRPSADLLPLPAGPRHSAVLKVKHIIVCGHYGCPAVRAALTLPRKSDGAYPPLPARAPPAGPAHSLGPPLGSNPAPACRPAVPTTRVAQFARLPRRRCALPSRLTSSTWLPPVPPGLPAGLFSLWIQDIRDTRDRNVEALRKVTGTAQEDRLVELNVLRQVGVGVGV